MQLVIPGLILPIYYWSELKISENGLVLPSREVQEKYGFTIDPILTEVLHDSEQSRKPDYELDIHCPWCKQKNLGIVSKHFIRCTCGFFATTNPAVTESIIPYMEVKNTNVKNKIKK